jgi:transcriptional regulator GlxA family with amidase domain
MDQVYGHALAQRFPDVRISTEGTIVEDGSIWTCSMLLAGVDLALRFVQRDLGPTFFLRLSRDVAARIAPLHDYLFANIGRAAYSERIRRALEYARGNLDQPLPVERLAEIACLSPRQFTRVFRDEVGNTPAHAVELLRIEVARQLLVQQRLRVELVAERCGFGGRERMRRAFIRKFGKSPRMLRDETVAGCLS